MRLCYGSSIKANNNSQKVLDISHLLIKKTKKKLSSLVIK